MPSAQTSENRKNKKSQPTKLGQGKKGPAKLSKKAVSPSNQRINVQNRIRATFTGTRVFDRSLHKTNIWLRELMDMMNWDNRERAVNALRATLHALRDILPLQEVPHLGAQFPILIRGLYYENWHIYSETLKLNSVGEFYELVREKLGRGAGKYNNDDLRKFTRACLYVITKHVSAGEMYDIKGALRRNLKDLIELSFDELRHQSQIENKNRKNQKSMRSSDSSRSSRKKLKQAESKHQKKVEANEIQRQVSLH